MPLGNFATILPFLSPCSPLILRTPPPAPVPPKSKNQEEQEKKKPALRICFPLKIQRGASSWWEYEEFRIEFRDRTMWRQALGLDGQDTRDLAGSSSVSSASEGVCGEDEVGAYGTFYDDVDSDVEDDEDRGMKSRWSYSSSSDDDSSASSSVDTDKTDVSEGLSATAGNRFMYLIPRLLFLTKADNTSERLSSGRTSTINAGIDQQQQQQQQQQLRPAPLKLASKGQTPPGNDAPVRPPPPPPLFGPPSSSTAVSTSEEAQIQHHREITLQKLEGRYIYKPRERYLSTFRSLFRTPKSPPPTQTPSILPPSPLRLHSPSQNPGTCRISRQEWANLRDNIVAGLSADAEALFPFLTDDQRAAFLRVEQKEGKFKVEHGDGAGGDGVKEALDRIEERGWEDVLFVEFEDTPRTMRWWYTMREPQVFEWGAGMI